MNQTTRVTSSLLQSPIISPSIALRLLMGAAVILTAFVLLTAFAVRDVVYKRAEDAQFERMQGLFYGVLGATDVNINGQLYVQELSLPERGLRRPGSPVFAQIYSQLGKVNWQSVSSREIPLHIESKPPVGESQFRLYHNGSDKEFEFLYTVNWRPNEQSVYQYTFRVAELSDKFEQQMASFDRKLLLWLSVVSVLLIGLLLVVQRWTMRPIRRLKNELHLLEQGQSDSLKGRYPLELKPLVEGLNTLLRSERARQQRYRNALGDIAHSLKTPLAVMKNISDSETTNESHQRELAEQLSRMQLIIDHQLKRAARQGPDTLVPFTDLQPLIERLSGALKRLRRHNPPEFEFVSTAQARVRISPDDLMEFVGNLMENAVKYGGERIRITFSENEEWQQISIEDDGKGFGDEDTERLLRRGVRADTQIDGQGIGLAMVADVVEAYEGELTLDQSPDLGGARATVKIPK